jgi:hypothetical protein
LDLAAEDFEVWGLAAERSGARELAVASAASVERASPDGGSGWATAGLALVAAASE